MAVEWEYYPNYISRHIGVFSPSVLDVLMGIANGLPYREIAMKRGVALQTIKNQAYVALGKTQELKVKRNMTSLVVWAIHSGLLVEAEEIAPPIR